MIRPRKKSRSQCNHQSELSRLEFGCDRLEERRMLAADVDCRISGDNLTITGTNEDDVIIVDVTEGFVVVNGENTQIADSDLQNLTIKAKGGNDIITIGGNGGPELVDIGGNLKVIASGGNDRITAYGLRVEGKTTLSGGGGNDVVNTYDAYYRGAAKIVTGGGNDQVCLAVGVMDGVGSGLTSAFVGTAVVFESKASVSTGGGEDAVVISGFSDNVPFAALGLTEVIVGDSLKLNGGGTKSDSLEVDGMFFDPEFSMPPEFVSIKGFEPVELTQTEVGN